MYKPCNVVLLPTKNRSNIQICSNDTLFWHDKPILSTKIGNGKLYITSDEEIKEGDWIYGNAFNNEIKQVLSKEDEIWFKNNKHCWRKIITTTDMSVKDIVWNYLPKIPQQFIQRYIEEYNKGNVITKVEVEYVQVPNQVFISEIDAPYVQFKVNTDNTINIKPIKDSWNREEVIELCRNAARYGSSGNVLNIMGWIEDNL